MDENIENQKETEIDLRAVFGIIKKNLIILIIVTILFGAGSYAYSHFLIPKQYAASAMLIVNNKKSDSSSVNYTEITAAQDLADVYAIIIKSDTVLQPVIDDLGLNISYEKLSKSISVSTVNSTQVIEVTMQNTDAKFAESVVAEIVKVAPPIITDKVEAGSVKVISESKISNNGNPVSPNSRKNALLGATVGLVLTLAVVFLKEFFNNTFKTENDILNTLNIPLIGIIPEIDEKEFKK